MNQWSKAIMATTLIAASFAATATWYSCSEMEVKAVPGFSPEVANIIIKKCTPCHAGGKSEKGLGYIDKPALLIANGYITPGDSAGSLLYKKVSATPPYGDRMPKGGPYLNDAQLAIVANWIDTMEDPSGTKYSVAISSSTGITTAVGGTCAAGTWSGSVYTTGKVTADCSVVFTKDNEAVVTGSGTGVTLVNSNITVEKGNTAAFDVTVRANDSITFDLTSIGGTCPTGAWSNTSGNHGTYTTGTITAACTVIFSTANPCSTVMASGLSFATDINAMINGKGCESCHDGTVNAVAFANPTIANVDIKNIQGIAFPSYKLVEPTKPLLSSFYLNVTSKYLGPSGQMPAGGAPLSATEQSTICNWILQGAN
jgi:hypothetical protein